MSAFRITSHSKRSVLDHLAVLVCGPKVSVRLFSNSTRKYHRPLSPYPPRTDQKKGSLIKTITYGKISSGIGLWTGKGRELLGENWPFVAILCVRKSLQKVPKQEKIGKKVERRML